ncbi:MAG: tetratricopeptide repeat protein [Bacteroidetes bacterium]|nr:tetratricopeptide repeat protein [Bacteroidota bacterium]
MKETLIYYKFLLSTLTREWKNPIINGIPYFHQMQLQTCLIILALSFLSMPILSGQENQPSREEILEMSPDTHKVLAWIDLAKLSIRSDFELGKAYADSAMELSIKLDWVRGMAKAQHQIGNACYYTGKHDLALEAYQHAFAGYEEIGEKLNAANVLNNVGLVKRNQGQHDEAMTYFFKSLAIKEALGNLVSIASTESLIGSTYAITSNYEQAEIYFKKSLEGFRATGETEREYTALLNMAGFYRETGQPEKSEELLQQCLVYFSENGLKQELGRSYYILGGNYYDADQLIKAEEAFNESKEIYTELGYSSMIIGNTEYLGRIALKRGQYQKAISYVEECLSSAREIGAELQEARALALLKDIYKEAGDYKQALEFQESYTLLMDSLDSKDVEATIAELEEKYQSEVKERELEKLTVDNQMNQLTMKRQRIQQFALLGITALLLVIVALIYNQYRINSRNNKQLREKNLIIENALHEKEILMKEIHHRVKNNLQFISSLLNLQTRHAADPKTLRVLNESKDRINSMSLVHQKLYQEDNLTGVPMAHYIENLLQSLIHSYKIDRKSLELKLDVDTINLDVDTAIPIGLILNEIITNAFKYAFRESEQNELTVNLKEQENQLHLLISDNGPGLPENGTPGNGEQFGLELVRGLSAKLKADVKMYSDDGLVFKMNIKKYKIV